MNAQLALPGLSVELAPSDESGVDALDVEWIFEEDSAEDVSMETFLHTTVLRREVVDGLACADGVYVDVTLGGGGHSEEILERYPNARVIAFDRDEKARNSARERLLQYQDRLTIVAAPFSNLRAELDRLGVKRVDGVCADLGVSSPQLDEAARGMSFRREGPIDMRMDPSSGETALELIGRLGDDELADVIFKLGDERRSRRIARSLKRAFGDNDLVTTLDLRRAIVRAVGPVRVGGVDPATRTFQALRLKVNGELEELEALLAQLPSVLQLQGRASIISFHSLEDRLVKHAFKGSESFEPLTKKPIVPSAEEEAENPRSRSAKLRVAMRRDL
jgi:16S rRNA (cytosine1402-N4)-methyltransferase